MVRHSAASDTLYKTMYSKSGRKYPVGISNLLLVCFLRRLRFKVVLCQYSQLVGYTIFRM